VEDIAHSLIGIFTVNMLMLYREGERAFPRLQEENMRTAVDHSIFTWTNTSHYRYVLLGRERADFSGSGNIMRSLKVDTSPFSLTNKGIHLKIPMQKAPNYPFYLEVLDCGRYSSNGKRLGST
jgi:hypothetical protein